jgi:hypothetical protein
MGLSLKWGVSGPLRTCDRGPGVDERLAILRAHPRPVTLDPERSLQGGDPGKAGLVLAQPHAVTLGGHFFLAWQIDLNF